MFISISTTKVNDMTPLNFELVDAGIISCPITLTGTFATDECPRVFDLDVFACRDTEADSNGVDYSTASGLTPMSVIYSIEILASEMFWSPSSCRIAEFGFKCAI